jgi:hypothetical protein
MFHMQQRLVESIHEDRHRETQSARLSGPARLSAASRIPAPAAPSFGTSFVRRSRSATRSAAA